MIEVGQPEIDHERREVRYPIWVSAPARDIDGAALRRYIKQLSRRALFVVPPGAEVDVTYFGPVRVEPDIEDTP